MQFVYHEEFVLLNAKVFGENENAIIHVGLWYIGCGRGD